MTIAASAVLFGGIFAIGFGDEMIAFAAKPLDVILNSNGFPSGPHFNLIIHGKSSFDAVNCNGDGGKSVFTPEYSDDQDPQTISMYANKKAQSTNLVVRDPCTEEFDNDAAQVQMPTHFETDQGREKYEDGFWVFARVNGKPTNNQDETSKIALFPVPGVEACNLNGEDGEETADDCIDSNGNKKEFVNLGFVTKNGAYTCPDLQTCTGEDFLERYDGATSGKGAKKAVDITGLFQWSGVGCIDTDGDEAITIADFTDEDISGDLNEGDSLDGFFISEQNIIDAEFAVHGAADDEIIQAGAEFEALLIVLGDDISFESCVSETDRWVFDVFDADLVIQNYTLTNEGTKNLQLRFYPQDTTLWTP